MEGFYDPLITMFDRATSEGFIRPAHRELVLHAHDHETLLNQLRDYQPIMEEKWVPDRTLER